MTSIHPATASLPAALRLAPALYATTLFVSALLLFAVQPMFTKIVLPLLGGSPSVWSVAIVTFQAALLGGYLYAHLLARLFEPRQAALVHLLVLAAAASALPIGVAPGTAIAADAWLTPALIALIAASVGLPFVAVSASAPLLQAWFASTGHAKARNPYVLYAASNLGSFAALLAYPFVIEPFLSLGMQARLWSVGYGLLALLIAAAALIAAGGVPARQESASAEKAPTWKERSVWIALAAVPSGLVVAVTAYISTDVAAAPFLWVVPLAIYLLTFVATFRERPWVAHERVALLVPIVLAPLAISVLGGDKEFWLAVVLVNLGALFLLTLCCHGTLYRRRPATTRLTEFYLWVSFGGVLGGIFAGLIAPHVFADTYEYPILILAALLALPGALERGWRGLLRDSLWPLAIAALMIVAWSMVDIRVPASLGVVSQGILIAIAIAIIVLRRSPARIVGLVALAFVASALLQPGVGRVETARSFFGVHKVNESADGRFRVLMHGTTIHGAEQVRHANGSAVTGRPVPRTYYYFGGPISEAIESMREARGSLAHVAAIGLGTGSLACHRREAETWTFYEIDPEVIRIARDPKLFRFMASCAPDLPIVLGDARLTLAASRVQFDLIVLDAFSSDAIPVHLLTREAFAGYLTRLSPQGLIVAHISNRHVELGRVVADVGASVGLVIAMKQDANAERSGVEMASNTLVAVLGRQESDLAVLMRREGWRPIPADARRSPWTDDYSDLLGAIVRKKRGL